MIIVKTKGGDIFLDEKTYFNVEHIKKDSKVVCYDDKHSTEIKDVESVRYISDGQAIDYTDNGSEIEKLKYQVFVSSEITKRYLSVSGSFRSLLLDASNILEALSETADPSNGWQDYVKEVKKYIEKYYETLGNKVKPAYAEIDKFEKMLKDVTTDGSV